jgi:hypothetical protein
MLNTTPIIDATSRVRRPLPPKAILWPTAIGYGNINESADSTRFPSWQALKARRNATPASPLATFIKATSEAQHRILVLDDFLFNPEGNERRLQERIDQVLEWLPLDLEAYDVRFLTEGIGTKAVEADIVGQLADRAREINSASPYRQRALVIQAKFTLATDFPYLHDRFAIIDDELWHFGATVGGLHSLMNAATRGWSADDHDALKFFENAWTGEQNLQRPRRTGYARKRT